MVAAPLSDAEWDAWSNFAEDRSGDCMGAEGELAEPIEIEAGEHRYRLEGHRLVQLDGDKDRRLRIGDKVCAILWRSLQFLCKTAFQRVQWGVLGWLS